MAKHKYAIGVDFGTESGRAVLVEVAYLSHPSDEALLATDEFRERAAQGIVNGVRSYVEEGGLLARLNDRERAKATEPNQ